MVNSLCKIVIFSLVLMIALPAIAGEGRTPLYQQTNITVPGKYIVTQNITAPFPGIPVFIVTSPDVDIDLNGFVITGIPGSPVIQVNTADNFTIRNGTLRNGDSGIVVLGDPAMGNHKVVIEDVRIFYPAQSGIILKAMTDFAVRRNNFFGAGKEAILIDGSVTPKVQGTIEHNRIEHCGGGIWVRWGSSIGILNNRLEDLSLVASSFPPAQGAIVYDYSDAGLIAQNTVENVSGMLTPTDGNGIYLGDAKGCKIYNNVVRGVSDDGIDIAGMSDDNMILENTVSLCSRDGLRVEGSRNHIDRNVLNQNCMSGTGQCWGLHFSPAFGGADNTYGRNTARGNNGNAAACPPMPPPVNPPTTDFCDAQMPGPSGGNASFTDNYMPNSF